MTLLIIVWLHWSTVWENSLALSFYMLELRIKSKRNTTLPFQAGFRKNYRTTDHIMTLFILIKKSQGM